MSPSELAEVVSVAGLDVPSHIKQFADRKPAESSQDEIPCGNTDAATVSVHRRSPEEKRRVGGFRLPGRQQLEQFFNDHVIDIVFSTEKYEPFGIVFPSAIVLYGPSGCGKTFAVEQLAEFLDWPCYPIKR